MPIVNCRCECLPQFTGLHCDKPYIPCSPSPCLNGGSCIVEGELSYACNCVQGKVEIDSRAKVCSIVLVDSGSVASCSSESGERCSFCLGNFPTSWTGICAGGSCMKRTIPRGLWALTLSCSTMSGGRVTRWIKCGLQFGHDYPAFADLIGFCTKSNRSMIVGGRWKGEYWGMSVHKSSFKCAHWLLNRDATEGNAEP